MESSLEREIEAVDSGKRRKRERERERGEYMYIQLLSVSQSSRIPCRVIVIVINNSSVH